mmetsp:Transcript_9560/g.28887  ORF Transcript_9560/g.28887 Transcript_9560/m.28887 type:complete len:802 (-) Transcript_9560:337-2742(-)
MGDCRPHVTLVAYRLPIIAKRREDGDGWDLEYDNDALYLTFEGLRESLEAKRRVTWIGVLNLAEDPSEDDKEVLTQQLTNFNCVPVWIKRGELTQFYQVFCKGVLWPVLHMVNYVPKKIDGIYDPRLISTYRRVNQAFARVVIAVASDEEGIIWIHDYHLLMLPSLLRERIGAANPKIGFFLHTPWPSSEMYRTLPWRRDLLVGMLSSSLLGFHLFDYARHFLSSCMRLFDLEYKLDRGALHIEYGGRTVTVRVSHIGIHPERFRCCTEDTEIQRIQKQLIEEHSLQGKCVFGAIDDLDIIKGVSLKLLGFEEFLRLISPEERKKVKLLQFGIPRPNTDQKAVTEDIQRFVDRINAKYGSDDYKPVEYICENVSFLRRIALYRLTDTLFLLPIRDGLNLVPYEYVMARKGLAPGWMILSESTGCSRALSSAKRVNPFDKHMIYKALRDACSFFKVKDSAPHSDREARQIADYKYIVDHSTHIWAESFVADVEAVKETGSSVRKAGGIGGVATPSLKLLKDEDILRPYLLSKNRLFFLDYDGTLKPASGGASDLQQAIPSTDVSQLLRDLSSDPKNKVFILSGRTKEGLDRLFSSLENVGLAAEHGFHYKLPESTEWKDQMEENYDTSWKTAALILMNSYTERTDGSYIEQKSSGVVWHYKNADQAFGKSQARDLNEHLNKMMNGFAVDVLHGIGWLQVRLSGVGKGNAVQRFIKESYADDEKPDFIFCAGDDKSDEDMFHQIAMYEKQAKVYTCVVGERTSEAKYLLRYSDDLTHLLNKLAATRRPTFEDISYSRHLGSAL